jgi:hypothetical protein
MTAIDGLSCDFFLESSGFRRKRIGSGIIFHMGVVTGLPQPGFFQKTVDIAAAVEDGTVCE